jgi:hypothetical protein
VATVEAIDSEVPRRDADASQPGVRTAPYRGLSASVRARPLVCRGRPAANGSADGCEGCVWLIAIGVVVYLALQPASLLQLVVLPTFLGLFDRLEQLVRDNLGTLAELGVTGATVVLQVLAGFVLAVVVLFFFLEDGERL